MSKMDKLDNLLKIAKTEDEKKKKYKELEKYIKMTNEELIEIITDENTTEEEMTKVWEAITQGHFFSKYEKE